MLVSPSFRRFLDLIAARTVQPIGRALETLFQLEDAPKEKLALRWIYINIFPSAFLKEIPIITVENAVPYAYILFVILQICNMIAFWRYTRILKTTIALNIVSLIGISEFSFVFGILSIITTIIY